MVRRPAQHWQAPWRRSACDRDSSRSLVLVSSRHLDGRLVSEACRSSGRAVRYRRASYFVAIGVDAPCSKKLGGRIMRFRGAAQPD